MINKIVKIGLGVSLLWYGVLRGARGLVLKVHSYSFRSLDLNTNTVALNLNLSIKNPLLVGLTIKGVMGDVYVQGLKVGYINTTYDYYLSGGRTHVLPVVVNLDLSDTGAAVIQNIQSGDISTLTIAFDGKIYIGAHKIGIPLQFELDYNDLV